jgi:hypothetical protein
MHPAPAVTTGVEEHVIQGVAAGVTSPVRTVADCLKYRHKVGLDVGLEALRDCWRQKRATMNELYRAALARCMANVRGPT